MHPLNPLAVNLFEMSIVPASRRVSAGVLAIVLGWTGIHKFLIGYRQEGLIMLVGTIIFNLFPWFHLWWAMPLIGLIEGIIYLTKSDSEFWQTYVARRRGWF